MSQRYNQLVKDAYDRLEHADTALTDATDVPEVDAALMLVALAAQTAAETYATLALADAVHRIALSMGAH